MFFGLGFGVSLLSRLLGSIGLPTTIITPDVESLIVVSLAPLSTVTVTAAIESLEIT